MARKSVLQAALASALPPQHTAGFDQGPSPFEPGQVREATVMSAPQAPEPIKDAPEKLPPFVILEDHYGWMQNGSLMKFATDQIVHDPSLVRELIARKAPLLPYL